MGRGKTNEQKKNWLNRYKYAIEREKRAEQEIQRIREEQKKPHLKMDGMPFATGKSDLSDYMVKLEEAYKLMIAEKEKTLKIKMEITKAIRKLTEKYQEVMMCRYIDTMSWDDICDYTDYSWRQAHRIHSEALKEIEII